MKKKTVTTANYGLPPRHFAILFEGAWIFTPHPKKNEIIAFCPFPENDGHVGEFGLWNSKSKHIVALPGFDLALDVGTNYLVKVSDFKYSRRTFSTVFEEAATKYPFVYMPPVKVNPKGEQLTARFELSATAASTVGRRITVSMPTRVLAAGAMTSAEIDGPGLKHVFGGPPVAKRPFTTFIFLYENPGMHAQAKLWTGTDEAVIAVADSQPAPHLIFNVHPVAGLMSEMGPKPSDGSDDKVHAITTFESLRQAVTIFPVADTSNTRACCDIAIYHDRGPTTFAVGDSLLTNAEVGIPDGGTHPLGLDMPACAAGSIAVA